MVLIIYTKNASNLTNGYWETVTDRQMDRSPEGRRQNYIPPTSSANKKQEGPGSLTWEWLFIKVLESIAPQQSLAVNFDISAVLLRLYMLKFPLIMLTKLTACRTSFLYISLSKTCDLHGGARVLAPMGIIWTNMGEVH